MPGLAASQESVPVSRGDKPIEHHALLVSSSSRRDRIVEQTQPETSKFEPKHGSSIPKEHIKPTISPIKEEPIVIEVGSSAQTP